MLLNEFKTFQLDRLQLEDLVALAAFGSMLRAEYEKHNLEEPDWVGNNIKSLRREIQARNADKLEARRNEIANSLENLKTPAQKRQELEAEKAKIDKQLQKVG